MVRILRRAVFNILQLKKRKSQRITSILSLLQKSQYIPPDEMKAFQERRLSEVIHSAYNNTRYYKELFDKNGIRTEDIKTLEDLRRIPVLTKMIVKNRKKDLINRKRKDLMMRKTSGSTSTPTKFYKTPEAELMQQALKLRAYARLGFHIGDRCLTIWNDSIIIPAKKSLMRRIKYWFKNVMVVDGYNLNDGNLPEIAAKIRKFKPDAVFGFPLSIYLIAREMEKEGISISPKFVLFTGEAISRIEKETIESAFKCRVYSQYGCQEFYDLAVECPFCGKLHINSENVYVEILNSGKPARTGQIGDVTVTDLSNTGFPLIRYQIGDIGLMGKENKCRIRLPVMADFVGRTNSLFPLKNGKYVTPLEINRFFQKTIGIKEFQMIQEKIDRVEVKVIKDSDFSQRKFDTAMRKTRKAFGKSAKVIVSFHNGTFSLPNRKRKLFYSKVAL